MITPGNTDDREPLRNERYVQDIRGKLCGDRGYIGKALFEMLFINGIQLVTAPVNGIALSSPFHNGTESHDSLPLRHSSSFVFLVVALSPLPTFRR